jgi:hypothetical protein
MKLTIMKKLLIASVIIGGFAACSKKLDLYPKNDISPDQAYSTPAGYKSVLAKIYSSLAIAGGNGPDDAADLSGLDGGSQVGFIRAFFNCQELPTDEAVVAWNDQTILDYHSLKWGSSDPFLKGMYARPIYNITVANDYLNQSTESALAARGITGNSATDIINSRAEVRFLRAFNYWVMLDLFGKSTFITEESKVGDLPKEITRTELYTYIESELIAIDADLQPAKSMEYGRVDKAAAWALLARLYLNAQVYTGTPKYAEAALNAKKVIDAGYSLQNSYAGLFMADNHKMKDEFIFTANCDGLNTKGYGNTTFFIHAAAGADFPDFGVVDGGGWAGYRATKALANLFPDYTGNTDKRAMFTTSKYDVSPEQIEIKDVTAFDQGLHVKKWVNIRMDGGPISDPKGYYSDIDFPIFRLAEMYLIYAEAAARGASGATVANAVNYINLIRARAFGNSSSSINANQLTKEFVLDERGRELYWEGHRRTDLIRYGLLTTGTYLWPWKGGIAGGTAVDSKYNLYAIPADFGTVNPNLSQNPGY